jgi:adhesin HecA-like repeat protein
MLLSALITPDLLSITRFDTNQTYQNEGKDTIAQANLAITANTVNNQGGQLAAGGNLNITVDTLNNTHSSHRYHLA